MVDTRTKKVIEQEEDKEIAMSGTKEYPYTIESFEQVGQGVCVGILDYYGLNSVSRIPSTTYGSLKAIKEEMLSIFEVEKQK